MIRLNIVVEGLTEEVFARDVLAPHLAEHNVFVSARRVTTRRSTRKIHGRTQIAVRRGGMPPYERLKKDLTHWLREDRNNDARFTTMFDLYGLDQGFPGFGTPNASGDPQEYVRGLEEAFGRDIADTRFIPYIQLHEFEALILSEPSAFIAFFPEERNAIDRLAVICSSYASPELIDDGLETAPSKRIISELRVYEDQKSVAGPIIARRIGILRIRENCPHFDEWITRLERLE